LGLLGRGRQVFGFIGVKSKSIDFGGCAADVSIAASFTNDGFLMMVAIDTTADSRGAALVSIEFYVNTGVEGHRNLDW
jgi:hypothetical protein